MPTPRNGMTKQCVACGAQFYVPRCNLHFRCCSRKCWANSRGGDPDPVVSFWMKVEKRGPDECWGWKTQKRWDGYGRFVHKRKPIWGHRFSYELHHGPIPEGMHVLHSCDKPECTNPKHLSLGTHRKNMGEMAARLRSQHGTKSVHAKLTEDQVRYIKANYRKTSPRRGNGTAIARQLGIGPATVYAIGRGRTWKHVA